jgi:ubiquitin-protein ligase
VIIPVHCAIIHQTDEILLPTSFIFTVELARNPPDGVSVGLGDDENIFCWELMIIGPPDTLYEGGFFAAKLVFPSDFPNQPPVMTLKTSSRVR